MVIVAIVKASSIKLSALTLLLRLILKIDVFQELTKIQRPAIVGRPSKKELDDIKSSKYIGLKIAIYEDGDDVPIIGKIVDTRPLGEHKNSKEGEIYYKAEYLPQKGNSNTEIDKLTETQILLAHKRYKSYLMKSSKLK